METKFSRICSGLLEAIWLGAIIIIPLFFNVYSSRIFEPDKISILRTLSIMGLSIWIVKIIEEGRSKWTNTQLKGVKNYIKLPFFIPVLILVLSYLIATAFSISPSTSFFGSYQRLQGLYTTFSYIILFTIVAANLRKRAQIERLVTVVSLVSLPVALYGVLQKYGLDPVPWEGDVSVRIASTMGNSIFVAAFLIMAFPLTLLRIIQNFRALLVVEEKVYVYIIRATFYVFIACLQIIAIYLSGSRGPLLGLIVSIFILAILFVIRSKKRWISVLLVGISLVFGILLVTLNSNVGLLAGIRESPAFGRFGSLLDPESNSALVRRYIWEGALKLVSPHDPLEYPDGSLDSLNSIRPIIGYGPETMFVAYNQFYIPELGQVEKRNASPDRSHNESWDAMITTGIFGLIAYLGLFSAIFYYSLKWMGLIIDKRQKILFLILYLGCGILGTIMVSIWRGLPYIGLGLPFGLIFGYFLYLIYNSLTNSSLSEKKSPNIFRYVMIAVLLSAILAHFVEINFGISIVATKTYLWVYIALLLIVGHATGDDDKSYETLFSSTFNLTQPKIEIKSRKKGAAKKKSDRYSLIAWIRINTKLLWLDWVIKGLIVGLILAILGYDLIANQGDVLNGSQVLWRSLAQLNGGSSGGILLLITTTWVVSGVILALEHHEARTDRVEQVMDVLKPLIFILIFSIIVGLVYWLWHSSGLASLIMGNISSAKELIDQVRKYEAILSRFYIYVFLLLTVLGVCISFREFGLKNTKVTITTRGIIAAIVLIPMSLILMNQTNLRVIHADIVFRIAGAFARPNQWPAAVEVYKRSNELAPNEDHYYLSLASAYFEQAKTLENMDERDTLMSRAEDDLLIAQNLNPLNTDHTSNLARLYNLWSSYAVEPQIKADRLNASSRYYELALTLSPQNSRLWNEWALLYYYGFEDSEKAFDLLNYSLEIDPNYDWTHGLIADFYSQAAATTSDLEEQEVLMLKAAEEYQKALSVIKYYEAQYKFSYLRSLASIHTRLGNIDQAIEYYERALKLRTAYDKWRIEDALSRLYFQINQIGLAQEYARSAYQKAPESSKKQILEFLDMLGGSP